MPIEHLIYIPLVLGVGFLVGAMVVARRPQDPSPRDRLGLGVTIALATSAAIFVLTHLAAPFGGVHAVVSATHGQVIFDQHPSFSADAIYQRLAAFGPEGRKAYLDMTYTSDLLFPSSLLVSLVLLGRYVTRGKASLLGLRKLLLIGSLAWFIADLAENAIIFILLRAYPEQLAWASLLGAVTVLKFAFLVSTVLLLAATVAQSARRATA